MAKTDIQTNLRLPADLKAELERSAKKNGRSMTAEVIQRLEESLFDVNAAARRKQNLAYADIGVATPLMILAMALEGKIPKDSEIVSIVTEQAKKDLAKYMRAADTLEGIPAATPPSRKKRG